MMNHSRSFTLLTILFLLFKMRVQAQPAAYIDLSLPDASRPKIEFNLDKTFIVLSSKAAAHNHEISALMRTLEGIHVRGYNREANNIDEIRRHYKERLDVDGWKVLTKIEEEMGTIQVHMLLDYDTVYGIFVVVDTEKETVFVNIVGRVAPDGVSETARQFRQNWRGCPIARSVRRGGAGTGELFHTLVTLIATENPFTKSELKGTSISVRVRFRTHSNRDQMISITRYDS